MRQNFRTGKTKISVEMHKHFKTLLNNKQNTIFAIIGGSLVDNNKRKVISYGDIIKTNDLKTLSKVFTIYKNLCVVKVCK